MLRSVLLPLLIAYAAIRLWEGENWLRWMLTIWCLLQGVSILADFALFISVVHKVVAPEQPPSVSFPAEALLAIPTVNAACYITVGLVLVFSRSLKAFLEYQELHAQPPFLSLWRRIRGIFGKSDQRTREELIQMLASLNASAAGGEPTVADRHLGDLPLHSGRLVLGDPQYMPSLEIVHIAGEKAAISARIFEYPSGNATVAALKMTFGEQPPASARRNIGKVGIDSARLVVADKADFEQHWTEVGKDRIGVITTARDDSLLNELKRRFHFDTVQINRIRAEIVGPVSEALEKDITAYLKSVPRYARFPFLHFLIETNNSFDRVNFMKEPWAFIPVGNQEQPVMFACGTGWGDGSYEVYGDYVGEQLVAVFLEFIGEDEP